MSHESTRLLSGMRPEAVGEATAFCPGDGQLAAWYEQVLSADDAAPVARHLSSCGYCRGRVGLLGRLDREEAVEEISEELRAQAKRLGAGGRRAKPGIRAGWATAAIVVLSLGLVLGLAYNGGRLIPPERSTGAGDPSIRQLRSADPAGWVPEITMPAPGSVVQPNSLEVRWTPVEGSVHYELRFMDESGGLLLQERLRGTAWRSTGALALTPGARYYLRVNAYLADGRAAGSRHVEVTVASATNGSQANGP